MNFGADQNFGMPGTNPGGDDLSRQLGQRLQASELRTAQTLSSMPYQSQAQNASLEETLKSIVSHIEVSDQRTAQAFQNIQQQMAQMATHPNMTNSSYGAQNSSAINNLESRLNHLVGHLENSLSQNAQMSDNLETHVSDLAQVYAHNPASAYDPETEQLKALDGQFQNPGAEQDQLDGRMGELANRISQNMNEGQDPSVSALQSQVQELHSHINSPEAHDPAFQNTIEEQLGQISQRLAETEQRINSMHSLEASFNNLNEKVGDSGNPRDISENKNALKALNQALGALRAQAKTSEEKTNETLEAVHDTLEKVITRIANLEQSPPEVIYRGNQSESILSALPEEFQQPNMALPPTNYSNGNTVPPEVNMGATAEIPLSPQRGARAGAVSNNFIQAARRAAQENVQGKAVREEKPKKTKPANGKNKSRRKPLLMAAAAVLIVIGGLQAYKLAKSGKITLPVIGKYIHKDTSSSKNQSTTKLGKQETIADQATKAEPTAVPSNSPDKPLPASDPAPKNASAPERVSAPDKVTTQSVGNASSKKSVVLTKTLQSSQAKKAAVAKSDTPKTSALAKQKPAAKSQLTSAVQTTKPKNLGTLPHLGSGYKELPAAIGSESLRRAAASGVPEAQFAVATHYLNGQGVKKDTGKALIWYQRAAAKGLAPAQYRLGTFYEKGRGVKQDKMTARIWYERAAEQGNRKAMHNLAVIYADANNGKPDFTKAALWFRKASERNLTDSQFNIGILSERGLGVPKDLVEAYKWFAIAGAKGDADSETRKNEIAKKMDPRSLVLAKLAVDNWTPRPIKKSANEVNIKKKTWLTADAKRTPKYIQRQLVAEAQSRLNTLGYRAGPPDGIMGKRTRDAIRTYQQRMGLKVTGTTTPGLIEHLRAKTG